MRIAIVSVTGDVKAYCDEAWSNSVKAQISTLHTWRHVVVNTGSTTYGVRLRSLFPDATVDDRPHRASVAALTVRAHERARQLFLSTDADAYLSWESDIIAQDTDAIDKMATALAMVDICMFAYPDRETQEGFVSGLGFTGFKRAVIEMFPWDDRGGFGYIDNLAPNCYHGPEGWMLTRAARAGFSTGKFTGTTLLAHSNG